MLLIRQPPTYPDERAYVLGVVLGEFLGLEWTARAEERVDIEITVPELSSSARLTLTDGLFATPERHWLTQQSVPVRPLARWDLTQALIAPKLVTTNLPVIYGTPLTDGSFYHETGNEVRLGVDILGSIFFQLTRYEEIASPVRDEHDRFPAEATLAHGEGFLSRPLVNEYVEILWAAMKRLWPRLQRRRRVFKEYLSHDVDSPLYPETSPPRVLKAALGDLARRHDHRLAFARLQALRTHRRDDHMGDPYNTFDLIMDLSERRGLRSAFYFMAGTTNPAFDGTYSLCDPWIGRLIKRIHERGHEIGLHPSYDTFRDPDAIRRERANLLRVCERLGIDQPEWGGRQHFLRWENPTTWSAWEQAGMAYDSSLGFSDDAGFRCGTCLEYPVFDLLARRRLRLRERPLVVMEMSLIRLPTTTTAQEQESFTSLRERCRMFDGDFTLLWHNSSLASRRERQLYTTALAGATARTPTPPAATAS